MWQKILLNILPMVISSVTPAIKTSSKELIASLRARAEETPNPWDNVLVDLLDELLAN